MAGTIQRQTRAQGRGVAAVRVLLVLVAAAVAAVAALVLVMTLSARPLIVPPGAHDVYIPATVLPQVIQLEWADSSHCGGLAPGESCAVTGTVVRAEEIPLGIRAVATLPQAIEAIAIVVALLAIRRALQRIAGGTPFAPAVQADLRTAAIALVAGTLTRTALHPVGLVLLMRWWDGLAVEGLGKGAGLQPVHFSWPLLVFGLVIGCLVVAFRAGARLEEDAAGVI